MLLAKENKGNKTQMLLSARKAKTNEEIKTGGGKKGWDWERYNRKQGAYGSAGFGIGYLALLIKTLDLHPLGLVRR